MGDDINTKSFQHSISGEGSNIVKEDSVIVTIAVDQKIETIDLK
ncbi:hypothetical protein [Clostridium sp. HBUAS56017]|nr:hypothetical protein [Clostridium sp. HBUAS56017]